MNRVRQVRTRKQQARKRAEVLEFPVTVVRNRTYIPRAAFLPIRGAQVWRLREGEEYTNESERQRDEKPAGP